jgi:hypothetical protein
MAARYSLALYNRVSHIKSKVHRDFALLRAEGASHVRIQKTARQNKNSMVYYSVYDHITRKYTGYAQAGGQR